MKAIQPNYIIAIGASAGGIEEIHSFFDHTPLDAVAYVIVQHLSADFKSQMAELLRKHSKLKVIEATNGMTVQSNQVYMIPSDQFMTIQNGNLYLTEKKDSPGPHKTINTFFNSLASDAGTRSIGVVLSGLGNDGTEGTIAIKNAGGMVIARDPQNSPFANMPENAIATGMVDFILDPAQMPATIESYVEGDEKLVIHNKEDEKNMSAIVNVIKETSPFDFSQYKQPTIMRRIKRRAAFHNLPRLINYLDYIKTTPGEADTLAQDFLISVTTFFRDKDAFEHLSTYIVPDILRNVKENEEVKLWVAGCATGEEAYSLAILFAEQLKAADNIKVKIFATDIDTEALAFAAKGIYHEHIADEVSETRLANYFTKEGASYKIKSEIRNMVIFAQHDLVKNPPYCNMHFISCRNLLIYMAPVLQKKVLAQFLFGLKRDGYLFLGPSESPLTFGDKLELVSKKWKIYRNLEQKKTASFDAFSLPVLNVNPLAEKLLRKKIPVVPQASLVEAVNHALTLSSVSLVICIDEHNMVVKTYGDTTKYLLQKNFTTHLPDLLPEPLAIAFNTLRHSAIKSGKKNFLNGIHLNHNDKNISTSISVEPLTVKTAEKKFLMVVLVEDELHVTAAGSATLFNEKAQIEQYTKNLEVELKDLKEDLRNAQLQLDMFTENMQSYNEEMISSNEEMQSINEEMQSVNEELHTINQEYQLKNKELEEVNSDLDNYFRSNVNGQLFVNKELVLMKFSPGTVKQINLLPTDIGRPLSNISTNIKFETLTADIKEVLTKGSIITREIETNNGLWYQVMTMPYLQQPDNNINGAIITFNDITELKKAQLEVTLRNKILERMNQELDRFVFTASHDLLSPLGNIEMSISVMNELSATPPELNEYLTVINSSVKKFRTLITDIATVSKVENNMLLFEMVDIDEVLENVIWALDAEISESKAVIERRLNIKRIHFSKSNLRSLLFNLISNSIKYKGGEAPQVVVSTNWEGHHVVLVVSDNGIGIAKEDNDKVFAMYGRLKSTLKGQGIGLYLVQKIIDVAGGKVEIQKNEPKGTKFIIHFKE